MVCPSAHLFQESNTGLWSHVSRNHPSVGTDNLPGLPLDGQLLHTGVGSFGEKQCLAHHRHPRHICCMNESLEEPEKPRAFLPAAGSAVNHPRAEVSGLTLTLAGGERDRGESIPFVLIWKGDLAEDFFPEF